MEPRRVPCLAVDSAAHWHHDDCADSRVHQLEISRSSSSQETIRQHLKDDARVFNIIQNNDNGFNISTDKAKPAAVNSSRDQKCTNNNKTTASGVAFSDGAANQHQQDESWPSHRESRPLQSSSSRLHRRTGGPSKYLPHQHQHQPDQRAKTTPRSSFSQNKQMQIAMLIAAAALLTNSPFGLAADQFANSTALGGSSAAPLKDLAAAESAPVSSSPSAAPKESLSASESASQQQQTYAPPVDPTEASANQSPNTNPPASTQQSAGATADTATAADQQQRLSFEDVPAVSGLVNQQEDQQQQQQQQQQPDQQTVGEQVNRQQQQQQQPSEGVEADQQQQISIDEPESESSRLSRPQQANTNGLPSSSSLVAENDVSPTGANDSGGGSIEQFARKASSSLEQQSKSARVGRTLKRAFGGHTGMVFGRKQRPQQQQQIAEEQQQPEQQLEQQVEQQQQQQPAARAQRGRDYHYYYTASPGIPQASSSTKAARTKLKEADYPNDYREILIQSDQQRQSPARPAQVSEQQQQVEQQPIEQVQVSENEAGAPTTTVAPLQTDAPTELPQSTLNVGEPDEVPPKSGPYIRLSNIATINSTANQAASNGSSEGEMKLMRIYVIDLDQKLVVGNQQQQQQQSHIDQTDQATTRGLTSSPSLKQVVSSALAQQQQQQQTQQSGGEQIGARASEPHLSTLAMPSTSESPLAYTNQQEFNTERYLDHSGGVLLTTNQTGAGTQQQLVLNHTIEHQLPILGAAGYLQSAPELHQYVMTVPSPDSHHHHHHQQQQQQHQYSLMALGNANDNNSSYASYYGNNHNNSSLGSSLAPPGHYNQGSPSFGQQQHQVDERQQHQVAVYLAPVQQQHQQVHQQQQQQMYPVVPQYIAPQYNTKQQQPAAANPDREQYHQAVAQQQLYSASLSSGGGSLGSHYNSPGSSQYNISSNYTSQEGAARPAAVVVQAPGRLHLQPAAAAAEAAAQAQDKHHANLNALYQQQQQHSEEPVYQQQLQQQQQQDFFSAVGAQSEPAQNHRKLQQQYNEPATYKVTTSDQWKPVDYSAPAAAYSQTSTGHHHHQAPINPAPQYANAGSGNGNGNGSATGSGRLINGYSGSSSSNQNRDHDVVSLANGTVALRHHPGHYQVELVQANYSSSSASQQPDFDGQHAPQLNYQANRKQQPSSSAYVNNGTIELQEEYSPAPTALYQQPSQHQHQQQHQQQVLLVPTSYHPSSSLSYAPSSSNGSYNGSSGSLEWPTDSSSEGSYGQQHSGMTNEYPSMAKLTSSGAPATKGVVNYGTGSASAYGKQTKQHSAEAPRIPHTQSAGYRQQQPSSYNANTNKSQPPPSAYLAVNGPPISDGVYESPSAFQTEQPAASRYVKPKAKRQQQRPAQKGRNKQPTYQQHRNKDHDSQVAIEQAEQYISEDQQAHQYGADGVAPPYAGAYPPRAPLAAVASLYRSPQSGGGAKSFLSWETISSVASGAAKRLPSLSSILSPFAGGKQQQQPYPTVNHQPPAQHHYLPHKSAHYDRDVASFHRPYPLRHTNQGFLASYSEQQAHPAAGRHHQHHSAGESQGQYEPTDLASSSSSEDGETQHSGQTDDLSEAAADEAPEAPVAPQQPKTIKLLRVSNGNSSSGGLIEASSELPSIASAGYKQAADATTDSSDENSTSEKGELVSDLAEINAEQHQKTLSRTQAKKKMRSRPSSGAGDHHAKLLANYQPAADSASPESSGPPDVPGAYVDPAQAAVLSSIEHQLEQHEAHKSASHKSPRGKHSSMKSKPTLPTGSGYVEPTITASSSAGDDSQGLSFDSLPADQQRLLLGQSLRTGHKPAPARFPPIGAVYGEQSANGLLFGQDGRPIGMPSPSGRYQQQQPGGLTSMQIGQYKITPQTQFVQSIIEPSRQVLGQYFKQYLGQLGQLAG